MTQTKPELRWTEERCRQLETFRDLIRVAGSLNASNHICENIKKCEAYVNMITNPIDGNDSRTFIRFLADLACADRLEQKGE